PPPAGRGQGRGRAVFPAQQRPPSDPAVVARGKVVYTGTCSSCHGVDARGGQLGGPNLLRSQLVLNDQDGELIGPIIHGARAERGMPPIPMNDDDVKAVTAFLHSLQAAARPQGAPPDSGTPPPDALVGNATAGQKYFAAKCSTCHTPEKLQGIAAKYPEAKILQNAWVSGGAGGGRGRGGRGGGPVITAVVMQPNGEKVEGQLVRIDDFLVTLQLADDTIRSFRREGDQPKVEIHDPLAGHKALLGVLTDKDMHDVTAYLATLK
ncbi:MAG: c-type cytochrome, partial [Vicinamibacterales bacterium]